MEVTDRITPYREGGSISERIDEIVAENAWVHFEMMNESTAMLLISSDGMDRMYYVHAKGRKLTMRLHDDWPAKTFPEGARE